MRLTRDEAYVKKKYEKLGWKIFRDGWPDFILTRGHEIKIVEVKSNGCRLSLNQQTTHDILKKIGITVIIDRPDGRREKTKLGTIEDHERRSKSLRIALARPKEKKRRSLAARNAWKKPGARARWSKSLRKAWKRRRKYYLAGIRKGWEKRKNEILSAVCVKGNDQTW